MLNAWKSSLAVAGTALAFAFLTTPTTGYAEGDGLEPLLGNWVVTFEDQKHGRVEGIIAFTQEGHGGAIKYDDNGQLTSGPYPREVTGTYSCGDTVQLSGGRLAAQCGYPKSVYLRLRGSGDSDRFAGKWFAFEGGARNGVEDRLPGDSREGFVSGSEVWRRTYPNVTNVDVTGADWTSGGYPLEASVLEERWRVYRAHEMEGDLPRIAVRIEGEDIPGLGKWKDYYYLNADIPDEHLYYSSHRIGQSEGREYLEILIVLLPDARPGQKILYLNGVPVSWHLEIEESDPPEVAGDQCPDELPTIIRVDVFATTTSASEVESEFLEILDPTPKRSLKQFSEIEPGHPFDIYIMFDKEIDCENLKFSLVDNRDSEYHKELNFNKSRISPLFYDAKGIVVSREEIEGLLVSHEPHAEHLTSLHLIRSNTFEDYKQALESPAERNLNQYIIKTLAVRQSIRVDSGIIEVFFCDFDVSTSGGECENEPMDIRYEDAEFEFVLFKEDGAKVASRSPSSRLGDKFINLDPGNYKIVVPSFRGTDWESDPIGLRSGDHRKIFLAGMEKLGFLAPTWEIRDGWYTPSFDIQCSTTGKNGEKLEIGRYCSGTSLPSGNYTISATGARGDRIPVPFLDPVDSVVIAGETNEFDFTVGRLVVLASPSLGSGTFTANIKSAGGGSITREIRDFDSCDEIDLRKGGFSCSGWIVAAGEYQVTVTDQSGRTTEPVQVVVGRDSAGIVELTDKTDFLEPN